MPYITDDKRKELDIIVNDMIKNNLQNPNGNLNYILFKLAKNIQPSYNNYKNFIGELNECIAEIRRRLLSKYEDEKIIENGDV
jgi:hypothetical protein